MGHDHSHAAGRAEDRGRLRLVLTITAVVLVVELVGAWVAGSLALLADAGHMATDAAAIVLALGASYVATMPAGPRSTFGWHRAEILAAMVNALALLAVCGYLAYAGVSRLVDPQPVEAGPLVGFALVGLLANAVALLILNRSDTGSLNLRGAATEVLADLIGSVLAVSAGVVILVSGWYRADPVASLLIAVLVLPRALHLLKESAIVLLEIAPRGLDLDDVRTHLAGVPGVVDVHDLHAWTITSGQPVLSAHVVVTDEALADGHGGRVLDALCSCLGAHFDLEHCTFQLESSSHRGHESPVHD